MKYISTFELEEKARILDEAGYSYNYKRELYVNRKTKRAFSVEFIEDHSSEELKSHIQENRAEAASWIYFFNEEVPPSVKKQLDDLLG